METLANASCLYNQSRALLRIDLDQQGTRDGKSANLAKNMLGIGKRFSGCSCIRNEVSMAAFAIKKRRTYWKVTE